MTTRASAHIVASRPLLAAGLTRLASSADVDVVDAEGPADFVLRSPDEAAAETSLDVTIASGAIVITVSELPDPGVWDAVGRVIIHSLTA
jgi:hypothetical protein